MASKTNLGFRIGCALCTILTSTALSQNRAKTGDSFRPTEALIFVSPAFVPETIPELITSSDLVISGLVIRSLPSRILGAEQETSTPVTDHLVRVTQTFKGKSKASDEVLVTQIGGLWRGTEHKPAELLPFQPQQEVILFLKEEKDKKPEGTKLPYFWVSGVWAGLFVTNDNEVFVSRSAPEPLKAAARKGKTAFLQMLKDSTSPQAQ